MNKFNQLLNENTIVDFRLLWKLSLRYRSHFMVALLFFAAIFSYNYYSQPVIFSVNVPLKAVSNHKVSNDLSVLLPVDDAHAVNISELTVSMETISFLKNYAGLLFKDPRFHTFNFGSINSNKDLYGNDIANACANKASCVEDSLAGTLRGSFTLEQGLTENRFSLTISAKNKVTVQAMTTALLEALEISRVRVRQSVVLKEIQSVSNLINESRSLVQSMDGYKVLEDQEKLQNDISDLKERIRMLQGSIAVEMANVSSLESKLDQNKRTTRKNSNINREEFERIQKAQSRLTEVNQNITILSNIPEEKRTGADLTIIAQLKSERSALLKQLPTENNRKTMELSEHFVEGQRGKLGDYEFDYMVAKNKMQKLEQDYEAAKVELNEMLQQKIVNESKVLSMKGDLDFLKNLESKLMSLKLLSATMTSDIFYEDATSVAREFRRSTYLKIFLFSFAITLFLYLISILGRYFWDDRIYGEEEIRSHLKNLDFIGEVPLFE